MVSATATPQVQNVSSNKAALDERQSEVAQARRWVDYCDSFATSIFPYFNLEGRIPYSRFVPENEMKWLSFKRVPKGRMGRHATICGETMFAGLSPNGALSLATRDDGICFDALRTPYYDDVAERNPTTLDAFRYPEIAKLLPKGIKSQTEAATRWNAQARKCLGVGRQDTTPFSWGIHDGEKSIVVPTSAEWLPIAMVSPGFWMHAESLVDDLIDNGVKSYLFRETFVRWFKGGGKLYAIADCTYLGINRNVVSYPARHQPWFVYHRFVLANGEHIDIPALAESDITVKPNTKLNVGDVWGFAFGERNPMLDKVNRIRDAEEAWTLLALNRNLPGMEGPDAIERRINVFLYAMATIVDGTEILLPWHLLSAYSTKYPGNCKIKYWDVLDVLHSFNEDFDGILPPPVYNATNTNDLCIPRLDMRIRTCQHSIFAEQRRRKPWIPAKKDKAFAGKAK